MTERERRFGARGAALRHNAARGTLVNTAFLSSLSALGLLRGFVLAGFLTASDFGVWGIVMVSLALVAAVQGAAIGDRYIRQDDDDQEVAFQRAFSISVLLAGACLAASLVLIPLLSLVYDEPRIVAPGLVLALIFLASPLQLPIWFHYRRMDFVRQRTLQAVDPVVAFAVSLALAVAGAGYWALVVGAVAGPWASGAVAALRSPYAFRWNYDRGTLREYWNFSWPLMLASAGGLLIAQAAFLATDAHLGLAAVGALTLASTITLFTDRIDQLVTGTLYPAIVAVRDRADLLYESFVKSNRLALMWAVPFGLGLSLFCGDLVAFVLGDKWAQAVPLLEVMGIVAAANHIGFNWTAYFRAAGDTRPMAVASAAAVVAFLAVGIPGLLLYDLRGLAIGIAAQALAHVAVRAIYLARLFDGFAFLRHALRAVLPSLPALAAVLAVRALETGERTAAVAAGELALYLLVTLVATWLIEGRLLREAVGYLRSRTA